jgi:hypothetical protein
MPMSRKGSEISQTNGNRITASTANGQQSRNKRHQPINRISTFIVVSFSSVKGGGCAQVGAAIRTPEHRYGLQPASAPVFEFLEFFLAGRADRPFVVSGFDIGHFGSHSL